jgi:hypothetical protein
MTFITEELGINSSNRANFFKYFNHHRHSNRWIKAVSYPAISILELVKRLEGISASNPDGKAKKNIISLF